MIRQYTATGATVEEAIANACRELGVSPDDARPEVLRFPKKGFLGFGKVTAEVRVTVETEDEEPKKPAKKQTPPPAKPKPVQQQPSPAKQAVKTEAPPAPKPPKKDPPQPEAGAQPAPSAAQPVSEELQEKIRAAEEYLRQIFEKMGAEDISIRMEPTENRTVLVHLEGGGIGTVIGKRGETLDAIQYLVSLAANRSEGEYVRFTMNAGNYREKREETLRALAQRMARKVLKTGRPVALEPMNPYERRIIHAVVTDIEGVYSKSSGEEPNRKVVIKPSAKPGRRPSGGRGRSSRPPREMKEPAANAVREAQPAEQDGQPPKEEKVVLDDNIKLYSKIEL